MANELPRVSLEEWADVQVSYQLTGADRALLLGIADRIKITELRDGLRIESKSFVGVVQLEGLTVSINSKLPGDNSGLLSMLEYVGTSDVRYFASKAPVVAGGNNLFEFFVRLFLAECHVIIKAGVRSGYRAETDELSVLRGRLLVREQFMKKRRIAPSICCEYDAFSSDILENRIIRSALELCRRASREPDLTKSIAILRSVFEDVSDVLTISPTAAQDRMVYNRLNEYYRNAHLLAWIIFAGLGVEKFEGQNPNVYSFLVDMNRLFEAFVSRLIAGLFSRPAFTIQAQAPIATSFRLLDPEKPYAQMKPDLYITANSGDEQSLPLDVKYKRYDAGQLDQSDLYQLSIYALDAKPINGRFRALLIYPSEIPSGTQRRIGMRGRQHVPLIDVFVLGIHVPSLLAQSRTDAAPTDYHKSIRDIVKTVLMS